MDVANQERAAPATLTNEHSARVPRRSSGLAWDVGLLAVAPVVAFFALRVRPMYNFDTVDANIYTGYAHNAADMMTRFGPGVYYWVRLGAIIPERLAYLAFGSLPGFYVLRYLLVILVILPVFLLLRSVANRAVAWLAVSLFLTSPVMYVALGSDYPDSVIFAYLAAAYALLLIPWKSRWVRLLAWMSSGALLALSLHSQVVSAPMVVALLVAFLAVAWGPGWMRTLLSGGLAIAVGAVGTTGALILVALVWLGHRNIFEPTITNYVTLQQPNWLALWHSSLPSWAAQVPYVVVPVVVAAGWVTALAATRGRGVTRPEAAAAVWLLVSVALTYYMQFRGTVATLEYRLYSSSLWPPTLILLAFLLARIATRGGRDPGQSVWVVTALVWLFAVVASFGVLAQSIGSMVATLAISAALILMCLGSALRGPSARVALAGTLSLGLTFLTISPTSKPFGDGYSVLPAAHYDLVLGHAADRDDVAYYDAATQIAPIVGPGTAQGQIPVFWASQSVAPRMVNAISGTYVWWRLPPGVPVGADLQLWRQSLRAPFPQPLVLLVTTQEEAQTMLGFLESEHLSPNVVNRGHLDGQGTVLQAWVVDITQP